MRSLPGMTFSKKTECAGSGQGMSNRRCARGFSSGFTLIFSNRKTARECTFRTDFFRKGLSQVNSTNYSHMIRWENTSQIKSFFSKDLLDLAEEMIVLKIAFWTNCPDDFMQWNPLSRAQYTEIAIFLSNYLLSSQGDRMSMGHAVEGRYPFLDYRVVEFAATIPPRYRLNGLKDKFILRRLAREPDPARVGLETKQPYRAPISRCFFGEQPQEYVMELLSEASTAKPDISTPEKSPAWWPNARNKKDIFSANGKIWRL